MTTLRSSDASEQAYVINECRMRVHGFSKLLSPPPQKAWSVLDSNWQTKIITAVICAVSPIFPTHVDVIFP